ncbi:MAG TPA: sigma-70 region 4 domain-containing protein [Candidatus Polarisedimenticolia bacterium]|nr:sigma-70 region 4 domain-containing protein [Candidatus Polarisedimenticolia bacterium]
MIPSTRHNRPAPPGAEGGRQAALEVPAVPNASASPHDGARDIRELAAPLMATARRLLSDERLAAAAVAEAFRKSSRLSASGRFAAGGPALLRRLVLEACLAVLRERGWEGSEEVRALLPTFDAAGRRVGADLPWTWSPAAALAATDRAELRRRVDRLPLLHRTLFLLRDVEEVGPAEAARLTGLAVPTVDARLHEARLALRSLLLT